MGPWGAVGVAAAGFGAGTVNTIVGSGSLLSYPVLLAVGYSPLVANVTNTVGLVPGSVSGAVGYRRELGGQGPLLLRLGGAALAGGLAGGLLLLAVPKAFESVVPALVLLAALLMAAQPRLARTAARRAGAAAAPGAPGSRPEASPRAQDGRPDASKGGSAPTLTRGRSRVVLPVLVFLTGVYGGYFGAAQGVILLALLALLVDAGLQQLIGVKNVLQGLVNAVAAVLFIVASHVAWSAAGLLAAGAVVGGQVGALVGRRVPARVLRVVVVVGGLVVGTVLAVRAW